MKQFKLLLTTAALMLTTGLQAQTDVTSTYITNADFEGEYQRFLNINTDRGVEKPNGWSVEWTQTTNDKNGMTFVGSMTQDSKTWSAQNGEKAYFTRMRWANATLNLRQTMTNLRPGSYTLSFYATASKLNSGDGSASVSVAGQSQNITVGTNEDAEWTQYIINFTVTSSTPYATIEITASRSGGNFKFGVDNFTLTYDGSSYYNTLLSNAQSLYDDNVDWAEGAEDLSTAITNATGKTTVNDKNAAIVALEEAMATFKETNTVDMTSRIKNPTFDDNINDWTKEGGDGNAFQRNNTTLSNFDGGFLEKWRNGWNGGYNQKNFNVYQTLTNLPKGEYTIKASIIAVMQGDKETLSDKYQNKKHGGPYYIDDNKGVWLYGTSGDNSGKAWANTKNSAFDGDGAEYKTATVKVENGQLTIGFKGIGSENGGTELGTFANWIACDNWTLSYFGFDPTTLKNQISSLKEQAANLLENQDYNNVSGNERTALREVSSLTPTDEKKATLEALISEIEGRINAFTAAAPSYNAYAEAKGIATIIEATSVTAPTTAAEAVTHTHKLYENIDTKVTASYTFDVTAIYAGSFSGSFTEKKSGQHWSNDNSKSYLDTWGSGNISATQTVTLPQGSYVLKVAGRGSADANAPKVYMNAKVGDEEYGTTVNFANNGDTGKGIDTSGAANYGEGTFANDNNGRGWEWRFIPVTLTEETTVTVTLTLERPSGNTWGSFSDFTILMSANDVADDVDYAALNTAITNAEANTLGFEEDEYAPYNNVAALTLLAEAKAIDQEKGNVKSIVQSITADLNDATWTANEGKVDAIYDGQFATTEANTTSGDINLPGWTKVQGIRLLVKDENVDPGLAYTDGKAAVFSWGGTTLTYGEQTGYTLPLNVGEVYELTLKVSAWRDGDYPNWFSVKFNDTAEEDVQIVDPKNMGVKPINSADGNPFVELKFYLIPTENTTTLHIYGNQHFTIADLSLKLAVAEDVTINETEDFTPTNTFANVTLNRTIKAAMNTVVLPFELTAEDIVTLGGEGAVAYTISDYDAATDNLKFAVVEAVAANTPFFLKATEATTGAGEFTFEGKMLEAVEAGFPESVFGEGAGSLLGSYDATYTVPVSDEMQTAYILSGGKFYKVDSAVTIKGTRFCILLDGEHNANTLGFTFEDGEANAINGIASETAAPEGIYNLQGQKVEKATKGIYIINGKKTLVK